MHSVADLLLSLALRTFSAASSSGSSSHSPLAWTGPLSSANFSNLTSSIADNSANSLLRSDDATELQRFIVTTYRTCRRLNLDCWLSSFQCRSRLHYTYLCIKKEIDSSAKMVQIFHIITCIACICLQNGCNITGFRFKTIAVQFRVALSTKYQQYYISQRLDNFPTFGYVVLWINYVSLVLNHTRFCSH